MTKYSEENRKQIGVSARPLSVSRNWMFDIEPYTRVEQKSFDDVSGDLRLKKFLKRAVENEFAPQSLIDSIRAGIRR